MLHAVELAKNLLRDFPALTLAISARGVSQQFHLL
jgi:hypothetical protein